MCTGAHRKDHCTRVCMGKIKFGNFSTIINRTFKYYSNDFKLPYLTIKRKVENKLMMYKTKLFISKILQNFKLYTF